MADQSSRLNVPFEEHRARFAHDHSSQSSEVELDHDKEIGDEDRDVLPSPEPTLLHRFRHDSSILVVAVKDDTLYAGTQGGELVVYDLQTFQRKHVVQAHDSSILGLCLPSNGNILLSSAGDRFVNVWNPASLDLIASIYSTYDIGDIFCVSWSPSTGTIYFGAQNTSIQVLASLVFDAQHS